VIRLEDIYNKGVNFLIGSGASSGLFPTLELELVKDDGTRWSLEELGTHLAATSDPRYMALFMHYYNECVLPAQRFTISGVPDEVGKAVLANYRSFLLTLLTLVQRRQALDRRCNVFTTNYDGCIPLVADQLLQEGTHDFVLNDGTRGFRTKVLEARNFNNYLCNSGVFSRHVSSVPQINLIHLHGSVYWKGAARGIEVDYNQQVLPLLDEAAQAKLATFSAVLRAPNAKLADVPTPEFNDAELRAFQSAYELVPIVNPTKWKFHQTVYEEHYYQMLRLLSYELERPNAVLVTFGFSFADEHILNLVKRSLSNPSLQIFVCCYSQRSFAKLNAHFRQYPNVKCLVLDGDEPMTFSEFNSRVLTLHPPGAGAAAVSGEISAAPAQVAAVHEAAE
jgi:hypothetical protein